MFSLKPLRRSLGTGRLGGALPLFAWVFVGSVCVFYAEQAVHAQMVGSETPAEMLQPRVAKPRGETRRNLERLERLVEQQAWDELGAVADELLASPAEGWVEAGSNVYVGVRKAVQRRLTELPPEGLAAYRSRVDPVASAWLEQGLAERDASLLHRIVDEAFCSSAADDALWALGEMALERGDYQAARTAWQRIYPVPPGHGFLAYPDSSIDAAQIRARLALAWIHESDFERAALEIKELEQQHPGATGRIAGDDGNLAQQLRKLLEEARSWTEPLVREDWPTLFANRRRTSVVKLPVPVSVELGQAWSIEIDSPMADASLVPQPVTFPILADGMAMFSDASGIRAVPLAASDTTADARTLFAAEAAPSFFGSTLSADRRKAFAVMYGKSSGAGETPDSRLVGIDLERGGALVFEQRPERAETIFVGTPVLVGSRVVICEVASEQGLRISVACYDTDAAQLLWRRSLGWAFDAAQFNGGQSAHSELAEHEGLLYVNTNFGMIAALRLDDGEAQWMRTYGRSLRSRQREEVTAIVRPPNPCIVARSTVFAAPSDSNQVLAFDAASGEELWSAPLPGPDADLLAIDDDQLLLTGERLWRLDAKSGKLDPQWGEELRGGAGQGALAGDVIFWPTAGDILLVDRTTGQPSGRSMPLPGAGGAHLVIGSPEANSGVWLIAAGPTKITGYRLEP